MKRSLLAERDGTGENRAVDSLSGRLRRDLQVIVEDVERLLDASTIQWEQDRALHLARRTRVAVLGLPDGAWGPLDETQRRMQRRLLEAWRPWLEAITLLFSEDTEGRRKEIAKASTFVEHWIQRTGDHHSIPPTIGEAKQVFQKRVQPLFGALQSLDRDGDVILVPDTNVVLRSPDVATYGAALDVSSFTVLFVPGVLRELDAHKVNHRNPNVREKAQAFTSRLKGWRNQGDLSRGVRVQGEVFVRVEGREPSFDKTLSWLSPDVEDDRILASILDVQRRNPCGRVVLLTGDTIMLAKADAARLPTGDTPELEPAV